MPEQVQQVRYSGLIQYLQEVLSRRFAARVSRIYFGDIGIYPPAAFGASRNEQKAIIAISPVFNRVVEGSQTAASEDREYGLRIIVMMNITPFFEASPSEAYAERQLTELSEEITAFLSQQDQLQLGGRVRWTSVGATEFGWVQRDYEQNRLYIRAAAIDYTARVKLSRV